MRRSKSRIQKIVNIIFLSVSVCMTILTIFFAVRTVMLNKDIRDVNYTRYISYIDGTTCTQVYGIEEYKVASIITLNNYTHEKMTVDMVFTYMSQSGDVIRQSKSINISIASVQDVYVYFYNEKPLRLVEVSYKLSHLSEYFLVYNEVDYLERFDIDEDLLTIGDITQSVLYMSICIVILVLSIILNVITNQMFNNYKQKKRGKTYEGNRGK